MEEPTRKRKRQEEDDGAEDVESKKAAKNGVSAKLNRDSSQRVHFVRGKKQYIYDDKNVKYLDAMSGVQLVGHCHPTVVAAGTAQMAELNTNTRFLNDRMVTFAQKLTSTLPEQLNKCIFVNSRSEANDLALQIAVVASGHTQCISLSGCYHGHLQSLRALSGDITSSAEGACIAPTPDVYRGKYRDPDTASRRYADEIQRIISEQQSQNKMIASLIHESIMTNAGMITLPQGFLQTVYQSVRDAGGVCIADEADCGLGRLGEKFWGFEVHGVVPDIVTLGESMGNGHPVGAVVITSEIADKFATTGCGYFNTFGGNPVAMAIAGSVLAVVEEEDLQENARLVGAFLLEQLRVLQDREPCIGDVRGIGLCVGVELVTSRETRDPAPNLALEVSDRLLDHHHIATAVGGVHSNVVKLKPPLCLSRENARELVSAFEAAFSAVSR